MCRLLLDDGLKAACTLFWISGFGFRVLDFGFRLTYIVQAAFAFCGADETRGKTSVRRFLRLPAPRATGGVQCGYGGSATPCAPSQHAIRHSKSSLHFPKRGAGCFFGYAANLSPIPRKREWVCRCRQRAACILRTMSKSNMQAAFSNLQQICPLSRGRGLG